jgi:NADH:ubiquinone reductase (H+-translocating)
VKQKDLPVRPWLSVIVVQFSNPDGSPRRPMLTGRPAALVKEAILRGAAYGQRHRVIALVGASRALA